MSFYRAAAPVSRTARPNTSAPFTVLPLIMHVHATRNNTIITLSRLPSTPTTTFLPNTFGLLSKPLSVQSAGSQGFKRGQRQTYEAGYQTALRIFEVVERERRDVADVRIEVRLSGYGQGRQAVVQAIMAQEGERIRECVVRLTDATRLKIGGTRGKRQRKL